MFTFSVLTFGCRLNQADSLACERDLTARGGIEAPLESADLVLVNTCSVTSAADQAARQAIRRIARSNPAARIVATGCYATRKAEDLRSLPGVVQIVENDRKERLAPLVVPSPALLAADDSPSRFPTPGHRGRTVYPLGVQTGCDERCSYCTIPATRGSSRSRALEPLLGDVRALAAAGYKELILTGVHLGAWGRDLLPRRSLPDLLRALAALDVDLTFRLSSIEPMDCPRAIVDLVAGSPRFAPHFHLPLQHASDRVLRAMRRPYSLARYRALVDDVRAALPDAAIGCDVIAGFPGETDDDHQVMVEYLRGSGLTHLHVFPYSERPGTESSAFQPKVSAQLARSRCEALRSVSRVLKDDFVKRQMGRVRNGLTIQDGTRVVTDNYLRLAIPAGRPRNQRVRVRVSSASPLEGEVVS